jgi:transposase
MNNMTEKKERLKAEGALHPNPEKVRSELVERSMFFDADDLVQMKYEMLRSVNVDECSITNSSETFGLSRVAYYKARNQYQSEGLTGLLPKKRGPKRAHKLTAEIVAFVKERLRTDGVPPDWAFLQRRIQEKYAVEVHPRSIERVIKRKKKEIQ